MEKQGRRRGNNLLTDRDLRATKPGDGPLYDGAGVRFLPSRTVRGQSSGQLRFTRPDDGKPDTFSLGVYPEVGLAAARDKARDARELVAAGKNPNKARREEKEKAQAESANTFAALTARWIAREARRKQWSERHAKQVARYIENHLSALDDKPIAEIDARIVADILEALEVKAPGMEPRASRRLHSIMDYAVEIGALKFNPLPRRKRGKETLSHFAAVVDLPSLGAILRAARDRPAHAASVNRAHALLAFTAQRIGEILGARWEEFDLDAATWAIPRDRMKRKDSARGAHVIPLPPRLLATLREWRHADGERATYVCAANNRRKPIVADRVGIYYREALDLQDKHSPHSWRSAFSTVCNEAGKAGDIIEAQLDHIVGNQVQAAYDRAERIAQRRTLLAWYESTLTAARDGADVVPLRRKR